jgi:hypothetical protein
MLYGADAIASGAHPMPFKPNYRFERNERNRLKQAKKEDKVRRQQERKAQRGNPEMPDDVDPTPKE